MNDPLEKMDRLAARARLEMPPAPRRTVEEVLGRLQQVSPPERTQAWFAIGAGALALATLVFTVSLVETISDPLGVLFWPLAAGLF
ncbi:MAG: hypothetical protein KKB20_29980 [Proteobacteria bacterium]|nr:hypothetical protein [Pseudomonadota bacterium]